MNYKKILGWTVLLAISFLPIIPWLLTGQTAQNLNNYVDITHAFGQLCGLIGMTMFALTFILSTRLKFIEDTFGGLDKVYIVHAVMGGTSLIMILFHPIFLVMKFIPSQLNLAASYLLPGQHFSVNLGIYALIGMVALIMITLYSKMKYNHWKVSHKFLGFIFMLAVLHVFLVKNSIARDNIFEGYFIYAAVVSIIGLCGFVYSIFFKGKSSSRLSYKVESVMKRSGGAYEITMVPLAKSLSYKSGQFIFTRFYNKNITTEAHPFSIASKSNDLKLKVIIKGLGDYTSTIGALNVGDKAIIEGPYGRFNYDSNAVSNINQIWVAGGIGITPFIGMAEDLKQKKMSNSITLYYSVKEEAEFINIDGFKNIEKATNGKFKIVPWDTKKSGYLNLDAICKQNNFSKKDLIKTNFYLCGPKPLKDGIKNALIALDVSDENIFQEEFSFR